jgi:hypothetical protein
MRVHRNLLIFFAVAALAQACVCCAHVAEVESRPRHTDTFRYRIECILEDLGVIPVDPLRHVNG